jgi:hypothetical protein
MDGCQTAGSSPIAPDYDRFPIAPDYDRFLRFP